MIVEIVLFLLLGVLLLLKSRKPSTMPPGSYGLPLLGDIPSGKISITEHLRRRMEKYGRIYTTKWGILPIVVLTNSRHIKKAFQHPDITGRSERSVVKIFNFFGSRGVINSEGAAWATNRAFLTHHLGKLGMGKTSLEGSIQEETTMLVNYLEKNCLDEPVQLGTFVNVAIGNVIWKMTTSRRYEIDDEEGLYYFQTLINIIDFMQGNILTFEMYPFLYKIIPNFIKNKVFKLNVGFKYVEEVYKLSEVLVREHLKTLNPDSPRDLIDYFLLLHPKRDDNGFLIENDAKELYAMMCDLFIAGSESSASTLLWIMSYMALYPEIQAKIHQTLDEVVPQDRLPTLADKDQLQYLDAMILDAMRLSSVAPTASFHRARADVKLDGYNIPKDTVFIACTEICHRDPAAWERPDELYPEHFLDQDGKLKGKQENFLPFSVGRRQCLGESLARMELYLFTAAVLHRFVIESPGGRKLDVQSDPSKFVLNQPNPFEVVLRKRK